MFLGAQVVLAMWDITTGRLILASLALIGGDFREK